MNTPTSYAALIEPDSALRIDQAGELTIEGQTVSSLLERFGSPCYAISESTLRSNFRRFHRAFASRWPGDVAVLYAIKANNNLAIRAILHEEGAGGDCFGMGELWATFEGGADPEKIVLNGNGKSTAELREALRLGVRVNVDNEAEIGELSALAQELGTTARVNLRLKVLPEGLDQVSDYFGLNVLEWAREYPWGFGVEQAARLVARILTTPSLELHGFHVHIGRGLREPEFYAAWSEEVAKVVARIHDLTGFAPTLLDIGGGYARHRDPESRSLELNPYTVEEYAEAITGALLGGFTKAGLPVPALWLEPGRYIVGDSVTLLGTVVAMKRDIGRVWVTADFSVNNLMRIETADSRYHVIPASRMLDAAAETVNVVGALCLGAPIGRNVRLPALEVGDRLAVLDAGMYAETSSTQMNGVPRPATVLLNGEQAEVVKRRETVEDVFAAHRIPDRLRRPRSA